MDSTWIAWPRQKPVAVLEMDGQELWETESEDSAKVRGRVSFPLIFIFTLIF